MLNTKADCTTQDAAAAALFTACKIEDTLKKSREILCAAYNLKATLSEQVSPDDQVESSANAPLSEKARVQIANL